MLLEVQKMSKDTQGAEESRDVKKDDNVSVSTGDTQSVQYSISYPHYFGH